MTVKELIARLQQESPDMDVYIGWQEASDRLVSVEKETLTVNEWVEVPQLEFLGGGTTTEKRDVKKTVVVLL